MRIREVSVDGQVYKLPDIMNDFQRLIYVHLINWKWKNITEEPGKCIFKGEEIENDILLPQSVQHSYPLIYPEIHEDLIAYRDAGILHNRYLEYFNNMASKQAANINLFLPVLLHPGVNSVLKQFKPDFRHLATSNLHKGFSIGCRNDDSLYESGDLGDHNSRLVTDVDLSISYYNTEGELCLWMIDHKFTEREFMECSAFKNNGRDRRRHKCSEPFSDILKNKSFCYYHDVKGFRYWELTDTHRAFFGNHHHYGSCPFRNGMNELWRKQLLGMAIKEGGEYSHVFFSVIKHTDNRYLDRIIGAYKQITDNDPGFSVLDSGAIVSAGKALNELKLNRWAEWYKGLYALNVD
jgi:hypothetical protein